jgi:hypothetical protein
MCKSSNDDLMTETCRYKLKNKTLLCLTETNKFIIVSNSLTNGMSSKND